MRVRGCQVSRDEVEKRGDLRSRHQDKMALLSDAMMYERVLRREGVGSQRPSMLDALANQICLHIPNSMRAKSRIRSRGQSRCKEKG
jgi:hypothetical protein